MAHLSVRLMLLKGSFDYGETGLLDKTHLHFYDYSGVKRLFEEGGYEITYLDPVLNDTSAESLNEQLEAVGLKPTKEFIEFTRTTDASVYQFVGAASPVVKIPKHKKLQFTSPVNLNQKVLNNTVRHFEQTISGMNDKITSLEKNNKLMFDEITSLKRRYRHLDKVYLFVVKIRKIINKQNH
jgi:hypothetical protein